MKKELLYYCESCGHHLDKTDKECKCQECECRFNQMNDQEYEEDQGEN